MKYIEKTDKVELDLKYLTNECKTYDIVDSIEIAYQLANKNYMKDFNKLLDNSDNGISLFALFVLRLQFEWAESGYCGIYEFLQDEEDIQRYIRIFTKEYFTEIKE